jgi:hypothetical protein
MLSWWSTVTQPDRLAILRKMLMMGSIAGTASGIMAGLTGMGGKWLSSRKEQENRSFVRLTVIAHACWTAAALTHPH